MLTLYDAPGRCEQHDTVLVECLPEHPGQFFCFPCEDAKPRGPRWRWGRLSMQDRADAYAAAFPRHPRMQVVQEGGRDVIYSTWCMGQDFRGSGYFGSYPGNYLARVHALFPEIHEPDQILHAFSGSLPPGPYLRCDSVQDAELQCDVLDLPGVTARAFNRSLGPFSLVIADPPYDSQHAARYGTRMIDRLATTRALAQVTMPGGFLVYLDERWPMHRKTEWVTVGRIQLVTSTNRRFRGVSIFERVVS